MVAVVPEYVMLPDRVGAANCVNNPMPTPITLKVELLVGTAVQVMPSVECAMLFVP